MPTTNPLPLREGRGRERGMKEKFILMAGGLCLMTALAAVVLHFNPIFVTSEQQIPAIIKVVNPPVVKAGQIWEYDGARKDPFRKDVTQFHIVAVKDGYVKWYFVGHEHYGAWAAESQSAQSFVEWKHLVK